MFVRYKYNDNLIEMVLSVFILHSLQLFNMQQHCINSTTSTLVEKTVPTKENKAEPAIRNS
jgi:hypothetical protein